GVVVQHEGAVERRHLQDGAAGVEGGVPVAPAEATQGDAASPRAGQDPPDRVEVGGAHSCRRGRAGRAAPPAQARAVRAGSPRVKVPSHRNARASRIGSARTTSSGSPAAPRSMSAPYRSIAMTNGATLMVCQGVPDGGAISKAHRQYAVMVTPAAVPQTNLRKESEYRLRDRRVRASAPSVLSSEYRFPATMYSDPKAATMRNHWERGTSAATPPATARRRKPLDTTARSSTGSCLRPDT